MDILPPRSPEKLEEAKKKGGCKNLREDVAKEETPPNLWPTTRASDGGAGTMKAEVTPGGFRMKRKRSGEVFGARLGEAVEAMENWPTPIVTDSTEMETVSSWEKRKEKKAQQGINLHKPLRIAVQLKKNTASGSQSSTTKDSQEQSNVMENLESSLKQNTHICQSDGHQDQGEHSKDGKNLEPSSWATPRTLDASNLMMNTKKRGKEKENTLCGQAAKQVKARKLNPSWVESLMLLPAGYTQIESNDSEC